MRELLEVRDYLNEGGKLLYTGKYAGHQYAGGHGVQNYDPFANQTCSSPAIAPRCRPLPGSGDGVNDVLEYWFGASLVNEGAGQDPDTGDPLDVVGVGDPFLGTSWAFNGADSAQNQDHNASFITTSGLNPVEDYPQFESHAVAKYDRVGGPFEPHSGTHYVYSQIADVSYKRLSRTITVPAGGGSLTFWASYDTELHWDHLFVEVRTVGQDDWTTLPDANGHTTQDTGESCPAGWRELHPRPRPLPDAERGRHLLADGYERRRVACRDRRFRELAAMGRSPSTATPATRSRSRSRMPATGPRRASASSSTTSRCPPANRRRSRTGMAGGLPGQPADSAPNPNDFIVTTAGGFPEGAVIATDDTIYMGFGFEGITDAATREVVMGRAMEYLLP